MSKISELRQRIASGEVKTPAGGGGDYGPRIGEGTFDCKIESAVFAKGQGNTMRGDMEMVVVGGQDFTPELNGGKFHRYIAIQKPEYVEPEIAMWVKLLGELGVPEDKVYYDADDYGDVIANICRQVTKLGNIVVTVKRTAQKQLDANGRVRYYNDIKGLVGVTTVPATPVVPIVSAPAPVAKAEVEDNSQLPFDVKGSYEVNPANKKKKQW